MSWTEHIYYIKNKISKGIGILCKARKVLKPSTLHAMYYSFIYPYLNYCIELWGSCSSKLFNFVYIFKLQKRVIRIVSASNYRAHTEPPFTKLEVLSLLKLYHLHIVLFMFKFSDCLLPEIYKDMFVINRNIHQHSTRLQNKLHVLKCRTNMLKKSLFYKGVLIED